MTIKRRYADAECTFQETISPQSFQLIIQTPPPTPPPLEIAIAFTFAAEGKQLKVLLQRLPHVTLRLNVNILGKLFHKSFHLKYLIFGLAHQIFRFRLGLGFKLTDWLLSSWTQFIHQTSQFWPNFTIWTNFSNFVQISHFFTLCFYNPTKIALCSAVICSIQDFQHFFLQNMLLFRDGILYDLVF